jgi:GntR family transcriptional regulator, transcriptional repressor for pyruvate dehydrogenase complex
MGLAHDSIARDLMSQLMDGKYPKGTKLASERKLAEQYGVSRGVVREALSALADRGLITVEPGRGAFASDPSAGDASFTVEHALLRKGATPANLLEARVLLEGKAAAAAAQRASAEDVAELRKLARAVEVTPTLDRAQFDLAFHLKVASLSGNVVIEGLLLSLAPMTAQLMLRSLSDERVSREGLPHHDAVIDAIEARNSDEARRWIEEHMALAARSYGRDYQRPLEELAREARERLGEYGGPAELREQVESLVQRAKRRARLA